MRSIYLLPVFILSLLGLGGCERETYTSWSCNSATETKIPMVLRKARMEFKGLKFDYCGSLGNQSYFDEQCPPVTQKSRVIFTPSSGTLLLQDQQFQCTAL
jgi:hypothetical protein